MHATACTNADRGRANPVPRCAAGGTVPALRQLVLAAFALLVAVQATAEEIYCRTDDNGVPQYTNRPAMPGYKLCFGAADSGSQAIAAEAVPQGGIAAIIADAAQTYSVHPALVHAVITVESRYNPRALSRKGASGLMQLMPQTARRYGVTDIWDPAQNVRAGAHYLRDLLDLFHQDLNLALAAYNAGENAVLRHNFTIPRYRETLEYVPAVIRHFRRYSTTYPPLQ